MKWIRVASRIADDAKIWRLAELAGCDAFCAIGHLVTLWGVMTEQAKDGDLSRIPDAMLEMWAKWDGKRGKFASAVRETLCDARGVVTAWEKYQGAAIREHEADRRRKSTRKEPPTPPDSSGGSPPETPPEDSRSSVPYETRRDETVRDDIPGEGAVTAEPRGRANGNGAPPPPGVSVVRPRSFVAVRDALAGEFAALRAHTERRLDAEQRRSVEAQLVFAYWATVWDQRTALLDDARERLIRERLTENGGEVAGVSELLYAIDGARGDPFAKKRDGALTVLLKDRSAVEEFARKRRAYLAGTTHPKAVSLARALAGEDPAAHAEPLEVAHA